MGAIHRGPSSWSTGRVEKRAGGENGGKISSFLWWQNPHTLFISVAHVNIVIVT